LRYQEGRDHIVTQFPQSDEIIQAGWRNRQPLGHPRAHAAIIGFDGVQVISGALQIGNVLALAIFQIGKPKAPSSSSASIRAINSTSEWLLACSHETDQ
jgi:hypothetical protein